MLNMLIYYLVMGHYGSITCACSFNIFNIVQLNFRRISSVFKFLVARLEQLCKM